MTVTGCQLTDLTAAPPLPGLERLRSRLQQCELTSYVGRITQASGLVLEAKAPAASVGELALVDSSPHPLLAEVVGFRDDNTLLMALGDIAGMRVGAEVRFARRTLRVPVSDQLIGRVLDGLGHPLDGRPLPAGDERLVHAEPPSPLDRPPISEPLPVGVRAIDAFLTLGKGQRIGIFAGSGVGKSTLLGMLGRYAAADVTVIALIGERGREVREFIDRQLGADALQRSVVVTATSDQPPIVRLKGGLVAMTIAEYFREQGADVLFVMDSLTRWAMAGREVGLAVGEPPTSRGYTPSVFAAMPRFLERAGCDRCGSITGLFTVLVEGDDLNDPIGDHARAILDGHIVLSRQLTESGHLPPIDVLASLSRVMPDIVDEDHHEAARTLRALLAALRDGGDLVRLGAYRAGTDPRLDAGLLLQDDLNALLHQDRDVSAPYGETMQLLKELMQKADGARRAES